MKITQPTLLITQNKVPDFFTGDEYEAFKKSYSMAADINPVTRTPHIDMVIDYFLKEMGNIITRDVIEKYKKDADFFEFDTKEDIMCEIAVAIEDYNNQFIQMSTLYLIGKAMDFEKFCYVGEIDCGCDETKALDYCALNFYIYNSPQYNLLPMGGGNQLSEAHLRDPLMDRWGIYYNNYSTHRKEKKTPFCLADNIDDSGTYIDIEMLADLFIHETGWNL